LPPAPLVPPQFIWAPLPGVKGYRVTFYRGGTRIYSTVAAEPRHTLPLHWTFGGKRYRLSPGSYRWVVVPRMVTAEGVREGKAIVEASYVVEAG